MASPDHTVEGVIDALDSFYCHNFALVVGLLGAETHRRADVKAALAGQ